MAPERTQEELSAEAQKTLLVIETLEARKKELEEEVMPQMLRETNRPVYAAKAEAEKIMADTNAKAEKIVEEANQQAAEVKQRAAGTEQEADAFVLAAKKKDSEAADIKKATENAREDFGAEKYASETNLATKKREADDLMGNALTLQTEQNARKLDLDSRESIVIKKEKDCQDRLATLTSTEEGIKDKIAELRAVEQAHNDKQIEIATLKAGNEDVLANIKKERIEQQAEIEKNRMIYASALRKEEEAESKIRKNAAILNSIAKEKAELNDKKKTLHENMRMKKLLERQIDIKISTLNKLRQAEAVLGPEEPKEEPKPEEQKTE